MELIYDIYKKLNNQEIRQLKQLFGTAVFEYEKVGLLFELVTQYPEKEEDFYAQKIYNKAADNTFRVTKARLKKILENVILNDKSLTGYGAEIINQQLQLKKKLLQAEIMLGRGAYKAGRNLLLQCISTAKRYNLYQELFQADFLRYRYENVRASSDNYGIQSEYILSLNNTSAEINKALTLHYFTSNLLLNKSLSHDELKIVRSKIDIIGEIAQETRHPLVQNAHYLSEIYYLQTIGDYQQAYLFNRQYLALVQENPAYYTKPRLANAYIQIAQVALQLEKMDESEKNIEMALSLFSPEEMNYLVSMEVLFRIAFYKNDYNKATELIAKALKHPQIFASKMLNAQWNYFAACVFFQKKEYKTSLRQLNEVSILLSDKYGKNIYIRMLEMMLLFELRLLDTLDSKIQNIRPFMQKLPKEQEFFRMELLYKLLQKWHKTGYDFEIARKSLLPVLENLKQFHASHAFKKTDFELIRLDLWMEEKLP
ncbi:MAG: hypothetical protein K1X92_06030 [Bacteroidia bacterium]|nr:hypothetical protein [Bacteroidia bacterium]